MKQILKIKEIKRIKHLFIVVTCIITFCFSGCEKVDNPYYFVDPVPKDSLSAESFKKVLLEDFTGIRCNNCPEATRKAEEIAASKRHRLIVMSIHAGHLAAPAAPPFTLDLRCPEGNAYYNDFKITGNPKGLINRVQRSTGIFEYSLPDWKDAIESELEIPITFKLKVEGALTEDGSTINAKITYSATIEADVDYNLLVFLVEDGIVGVQKDDYGNPIWDYVFHNVLRETLHGDAYYGIPIKKPVAGVENTYSFDNYKIKSIDKKYPTSTYKLIVAITQRESKYIEQVEEIGLR
jgi:hypothetical protein